MVKELREFLLRGNVVDLAVAVVVGAAFTVIITTTVDGIINPLISLIIGQPDLETVDFTLREATFEIGLVLQAVINFVIVGLVLFFFIKAANQMMARRKGEPESPAAPPEPPPEDIVLLREIRDALRRNVPPPPPGA